MIEIKFKAGEVQAELARLAVRLGSPEAALRSVLLELKMETSLAFERQTAPDGQKWERLADATLKARKGRRRGGNILVDTAKLRNSLTVSVRGNRGSLSVWGPYAAIHQFGGQAGRGKKVAIRARPYLPIDRNDPSRLMPKGERAIVGMIRRFLETT